MAEHPLCASVRAYLQDSNGLEPKLLNLMAEALNQLDRKNYKEVAETLEIIAAHREQVLEKIKHDLYLGDKGGFVEWDIQRLKHWIEQFKKMTLH